MSYCATLLHGFLIQGFLITAKPEKHALLPLYNDLIILYCCPSTQVALLMDKENP